MSQILNATKRSIRNRATTDYEDLDKGKDMGVKRNDAYGECYESLGSVTQDLEMNSVSVVPDGMVLVLTSILCFILLQFCYLLWNMGPQVLQLSE